MDKAIESLYDWITELAILCNDSPFNLVSRDIEELRMVEKSLNTMIKENRLPAVATIQTNQLIKAYLGVK